MKIFSGVLDATNIFKTPLIRGHTTTDSPYLAPTPYRGKRNESAYIPLIAQKLADIHQTSIENIANITTKNAEKIFSI